jgi:hypothetical protein
MKLARPATRSLWVAERRGISVFVLGGKVGAPGVPKAREFRTEAEAEAYIAQERTKRLAEGFVVVDETTGLDAPFTLDGKPKPRALPARYEPLAERVRLLVRGGHRDAEAIDGMIDEMLADDRVATRLDGRRERRAAMTLDERVKDERFDSAAEQDARDAPSKVADALREIARTERAALRRRAPPVPDVNAAIDRAFAALEREGIVALQAAGFDQSEGWEEANATATRMRARGIVPKGATFFHEQDLERAVKGEGLHLTFGAYDGDSGEISRSVVAALRAEGVDATWNGDPNQRIAIAPFEWYRKEPG